MTPEQARDLQAEAKKIAERIHIGHQEPDDVLMIALTLVEILAHIAAREEARARVPRKN